MKTSRFISLLLCVVMIMSLFTGLAGSASADDVITHEVQSGEIMLKICEKHGLNYYACKDAIMALNGFTSEAQLGKLTVGQKLRLPASDSLAKTTSTSTAVVTSTTVGGTTLTTTTNYVGTPAASGSVAYYLTPYTVQAGDTLAGICSKLNSNYYYYSPVILGVNALANANYIRPGQVLLIPTTSASSGGYSVVAHTVQAGENMTAICNRYGISYQAMRTLVNGVNRRDNMDKIYVGQTVYVPGTASGVAAAATTTVTTSGTITATSGGTAATATTPTATAGAAYSISFSNSSAFASSNGKDYVTAAAAGSEVSVWSVLKSGYALKGIQVVRLDTGALVPVDYNYFTMPNSNVYVEVEYEKGLTIQKEKSLYGSFDALVYGSSASAAFQDDEVTVVAYPFNSYSVSSVTYQKSDRSVSAVEVKPDKSGNYKFTMPSYPILLKVTFAPTEYHKLTAVNTLGRGTVQFKVGNEVVTKAEKGQTVTMSFIPANNNWEFNGLEFERNLFTHMPARNSVTNFQKLKHLGPYSFVMGSSDIVISGAQFLDRNSYDLTIYNQSGHGSATFNVISQANGAITRNAKTAKFGDTVQVILSPDNNFVNDVQYMKDNSWANGNLLPWGVGTTSFTMPDGTAVVNLRFIEDGAYHTYSGVSAEVSPAAGGIVTILDEDGNPVARAEAGKKVTISINPNPNYAVNLAKRIGMTDIWAVTVNGYYTNNAPAAYSFTCVDQNTFTFINSGGHDTVRVVFASDFQSIPVKFQQVIAGTSSTPSIPPVKGIKSFKVNEATMDFGANVRAGDSVGFTVELEEGYEVVQVRKFVQDGTGTEVPGSSYLISGGSFNGYSYWCIVPASDIHRNSTGDIDGELVFEITAQQKSGYSYTVHYTEPMADGQRISSFSPGNGIYYLDVVQTSSAATLGSPDPRPNPLGNNGDISDISANRVEADDALIIVTIPVAKNNNIQKKDTAAQKKYVYSFEKLLINGSEWPVESDGVNYIAKIPYPKDTANRVVTTELVYKASGPYDFPLATLSDIKIDNAALTSFNPNVLNYSVDSSNVDGSVTPLADATPATGLERKILINGLVYMDYGATSPSSGTWVWHYGGNDVQIYVRDADPANAPDVQDNIYKVSVNCGKPAAKLTALSITGGGQPATGMAEFSPTITNYEAFVADKSVVVAPTADAGCSYTVVITDPDGKEIANVTDAPASATLGSGKNIVTVTVEGPDKTKSEYKVTVFCDYDATTTESSALESIDIGNGKPGTLTAALVYDETIDIEKSNVTASFPASGTGNITIKVNGVVANSGAASPSLTAYNVKWNTGSNTVEVTAEETGKSPVTYTVNVTCNLEASKLTTLEIDGTNYVDSEGKLTQSEVKVTLDESSVKFATTAFEDGKFYIDDGSIYEFSWASGSSYFADWKWADGVVSRELKVTVKETNKTETTYTLTIVDDRPESTLENYLSIGGSLITFDSDRKATAPTQNPNSDVRIVLLNGPTLDSIKVYVNGTPQADGDTGSDGAGNPTRDYFASAGKAIAWPTTDNEFKITVRYENYKESTYTVTVPAKGADATLKELKIGSTTYPAADTSGIKLHDLDTITATTNDPTATVQITVYGDATAGSPFVLPAKTHSDTVTEGSGIHWDNSGTEGSNRIEVTVENGTEKNVYVYTGKRIADTSLSTFTINSIPYSAGATGIVMKSADPIVVTANDSTATVQVTIKGDGVGPWVFTATHSVSVTEGTDFQWAPSLGSNLITVTVTNGSDSETYTYSGNTQ